MVIPIGLWPYGPGNNLEQRSSTVSDVFEDQRKFMRACGQTIDEFNQRQYDLYRELIREEMQELIDAKDRTEQLDALIDIMVVTAGALHSLGVDGPGAWKEVMRSNFAKIDPITGRVNRREDGKILKPANWEPPRLQNYIRN
jgi:predicted HAD superfamily Cof-like phosphohydrolase